MYMLGIEVFLTHSTFLIPDSVTRNRISYPYKALLICSPLAIG